MINNIDSMEVNRKPQKIYLGDLLEIIKPHTKIKFIDNATDREIDKAPFDAEVFEIDLEIEKAPQSNYEICFKLLLEIEDERNHC